MLVEPENGYVLAVKDSVLDKVNGWVMAVDEHGVVVSNVVQMSTKASTYKDLREFILVVRKGDIIAVVFGCEVPVVVRKRDEWASYLVLGDAFVVHYTGDKTLQQLEYDGICTSSLNWRSEIAVSTHAST